MDWIIEFRFAFLVPFGIYSVLFIGGAFSDNLSYPWKHWTVKQTIGMFLLGPALGLLLAGVAMIFSLYHQSFIFERWWTAASFILLSFLFLRCFEENAFSGKSCSERKEEWEKIHRILP